jgi:molybdopterin molybdotransferase
MISYQEALQIILKHGSPTQTATLPLLAALGETSAADVKSAMDVPSFRNSAMDGFAVRCADIAGATVEKPVTLPVSGAIAAGDVVSEGKDTMQIMTGAPVPEPFDAVIPVEKVTAANSIVTFTRPASMHENIRFPGEDVRAGQAVLHRGEIITAERIMLLAALGVTEVETHKIPAVHILSTGKEIIDDHASPLPQGKIYNSNAPYLMACCKQEGFAARYEGIIADDVIEFETRVSAIPAGSIIITTGAVSKGVWDFIPESLKRLGANTHFHRVNIRPGKPVLFATLPNGSWFFGLPGNPISTAIGFRFFVLHMMRALQGLSPEQPLMARLENSFVKKGNFRQFLKATLKVNPTGELLVTISSGQESFKISPMAENNAWAALEEPQTEYKVGALIPVFPFSKMSHFPSTEELLCKAA